MHISVLPLCLRPLCLTQIDRKLRVDCKIQYHCNRGINCRQKQSILANNELLFDLTLKFVAFHSIESQIVRLFAEVIQENN